ncbi:short-chain dehydrogenase [Pseudorhizobium halotolerans]|uniref:Short-chain dehydrogenase n=1 Tax=Pseudorhizobium halotolerans TaxID=1233081 RepID=A0ABN7JXJ8_9HYPH|nr:SDR family oxidoreductase [Pseudorhizobium halotolerans]CAD7053297.1 short-chain dehydrogenase [Pseudorhizobium halotolerans]
MDMFLTDKSVIVTGAGSGIGAATARLFIEEGARVVVADFDADAAARIASELGPKAVSFQVDVCSENDCKALAAFADKTFGGIDILVNNAGRGILGTVENTTLQDWNAIMEVNVNGVYLCSKHAIPIMRRGGGGAIVNTASNIAMAVAIKDRAAYVAAKGAVASMTRAMALDFADDNIRVNSVAPGVIWSSYFGKMLTEVSDPEAFKAGLRARAPTNRWGEPIEIGNAIIWLASSRASYATGTMLTVDGGASIW